jgi:hypothetical protein
VEDKRRMRNGGRDVRREIRNIIWVAGTQEKKPSGRLKTWIILK